MTFEEAKAIWKSKINGSSKIEELANSSADHPYDGYGIDILTNRNSDKFILWQTQGKSEDPDDLIGIPLGLLVERISIFLEEEARRKG